MTGHDPREADLAELLSLIRGDIGILGPGIHTYPNRDEKHQKLFEDCVELERRGVIYRFRSDPNHVIWKPKEPQTTD